MIQNLERYLDHLDVIREDLLPLVVVELEKEGLIVVVTEPYESISHLNLSRRGDYEKSDKEAN